MVGLLRTAWIWPTVSCCRHRTTCCTTKVEGHKRSSFQMLNAVSVQTKLADLALWGVLHARSESYDTSVHFLQTLCTLLTGAKPRKQKQKQKQKQQSVVRRTLPLSRCWPSSTGFWTGSSRSFGKRRWSWRWWGFNILGRPPLWMS